LQPGETFVHPVTGFQVASVHSIAETSAKLVLLGTAVPAEDIFHYLVSNWPLGREE
jgi:hypothetical protein